MFLISRPAWGDAAEHGASWLPPTLVALGAILVYATSLANGFTYDDVAIIVENPAVHDLADLFRIWITPYWPGPDGRLRGLYRPLTTFLFGIQWRAGGGSPLLFHVLNVLLHAAAAVLVYYLLMTFVAWKYALGAALLFAAHPLHVEAVANTVGQAELVSACMVLVAAVLYARRPLEGEVTGGLRRRIGGCFLLGLLAKEHAVVLPVILLILDVAQGRVRRAGYVSTVAKLAILLTAELCVYFAVRSIVLGGGLTGDVTFDTPSLRDSRVRVMTALSVWPQYLRLLVAPLHLSAMYDPETIPFLRTVTPSVVIGTTLLLFVIVTTGIRSAWPAIGLGSAWFLTTVLLVSNLLFPIGTVLGERTLYLPSVALSIWVGFGLKSALDERSRHRIPGPLVWGAFTIVLASFGVRTAVRNTVWSDNQRLFTTTVRDHPENFRAQWFYARELAQRGDSAGSVPHWRRSLEISPDSPRLLVGYAHFLLARGNPEQADQLAARALALRPESPDALLLQGLIDIALDRRSQAQNHVDRLAGLGFRGFADQLADSLAAAGRYDPR